MTREKALEILRDRSSEIFEKLADVKRKIQRRDIFPKRQDNRIY